MLLKRIIIVSFTLGFGSLIAACEDDAKDACEHIAKVCDKDTNVVKADCSQSNGKYEGLSDVEKEKQDKLNECIMDADDCEAVKKCSLPTTSTG